ncbi:MAG TPA: VWA domain-containing protein [Terriglobia bacterium]|nr:VWA domain-containing protein [Terriglobia bacterium]
MRTHDATGNPKGLLLMVTAVTALLMLSRSARPQVVSPGNPQGEYKISVNVGLVVLPATVTDHTGDFVPGLGAANFQVFEAGRLQQITLFEPEDVPVTVGLVVDNSGSMRSKRPGVVVASLAFVKSSNPSDQMFVVNFNQDVSLGLPKSVPFTSDAQQLRAALVKIPPAGNTALYDGIAAGLQRLKAGTAVRKALIVVTDGGDNASRLKFRDLIRMAQGSNAIVYTIGILDQSYSDENPGVLRQLAKVTGGQAYFPTSLSEVQEVTERIARDIRQQYTIGYVPANPVADGKFRAIRVTAKAARVGKLHVRTRAGYLPPSEAALAAR